MANINFFEEIKLTELLCADQFEDCLINNIYNELPKFDNILREVPCKQGIADFICFNDTQFIKKNSSQMYKISEKLGKSFIPVLSSLLNNNFQDIQSLSMTTGYDIKRLNNIIKVLKNEKIIKQNKIKKQYSLYAEWKKFDVELWAFELKLKNWKRAIYQAAQYQTFTDKVFTVFPNNRKQLLLKNIERFKKLNIGCAVQDYKNKSLEILYYPVSKSIKYNGPYLFALTETIKSRQEAC